MYRQRQPCVAARFPYCMRIGRVTTQGCLAMNERIIIRHCEEHGDEAIQGRADMESAPT